MPKWKRSLRASWEARPRASRIQDTAMTSRKLRSTLEGAVRSIFASAMRQRSALTALLPCEGPNDFHAVQKSTTEARGEKRDRVASTLSEEDASSDSDRESAKRRRTFREDNGRPLKSASPPPPGSQLERSCASWWSLTNIPSLVLSKMQWWSGPSLSRLPPAGLEFRWIERRSALANPKPRKRREPHRRVHFLSVPLMRGPSTLTVSPPAFIHQSNCCEARSRSFGMS
jgi:hypothetical protein